MKVVNQTLNILRLVLVWVAGSLLVAMAVLTLAQVLFRYVLDSPLSWAEEATRMAMIWATFTGMAAMWASREHIAITALPDLLPARQRTLVQLLVDATVLVVAVFLLWFGWKVTQAGMATLTIALGVPWGYAYASVPVAAASIVLFTSSFLVQNVSKLGRGVPA